MGVQSRWHNRAGLNLQHCYDLVLQALPSDWWPHHQPRRQRRLAPSCPACLLCSAPLCSACIHVAMEHAWTDMRRVVRALVRRFSVEPSVMTGMKALSEALGEFTRCSMMLRVISLSPGRAEAPDLLL